MPKLGKTYTMKDGRWDSFVGTRYIGSFRTQQEAAAAAKKSDEARAARKLKAAVDAARRQPATFVCVRGRCVKVCG